MSIIVETVAELESDIQLVAGPAGRGVIGIIADNFSKHSIPFLQTRESLANTLSIPTHGSGHLVEIIDHKRDQSSSDGDQQKLTMRVKKENFEVIEYLINERSRKLKF